MKNDLKGLIVGMAHLAGIVGLEGWSNWGGIRAGTAVEIVEVTNRMFWKMS